MDIGDCRMSDLTEKWKSGKLINEEDAGCYYIETIDGEIYPDCLSPIDRFKNTYNYAVKKILAPVPSYEEWEEKQKALKVLAEAYCKEKEENDKLKAQITKLTEIVGVLPSNHNVGNLGYKIKNQRHEINNRLKEIDKLKELLEKASYYLISYKNNDTLPERAFYEEEVSEFLDKIDEVLK